MARRIDITQTLSALGSLAQKRREDEYNRQLEKQREEQRKAQESANRAGQLRTIGTIGGAIVGGMYGGLPGASAGASIGSTAGGVISQGRGDGQVGAGEIVQTGLTAASFGVQQQKLADNKASNATVYDNKYSSLESSRNIALNNDNYVEADMLKGKMDRLSELSNQSGSMNTAQFSAAANRIEPSAPTTQDIPGVGQLVTFTNEATGLPQSKLITADKKGGEFNLTDRNTNERVLTGQTLEAIQAAMAINNALPKEQQKELYETKTGQDSTAVRMSEQAKIKQADREKNNATLINHSAAPLSEDTVERTEQIVDPKFQSKPVLTGSVPTVEEVKEAVEYTEQIPAVQASVTNSKVRAVERNKNIRNFADSNPKPEALTKYIGKQFQKENVHQAYETEYARLSTKFGTGTVAPKFVVGDKSTVKEGREEAIRIFSDDYANSLSKGLMAQSKESRVQGKDLSISTLEEAVSNFNMLDGKTAAREGALYSKKLDNRYKQIDDRKQGIKAEAVRVEKVETGLRKEYNGLIKEYNLVEDKMALIKASAEDGEGDGISDLSMIFAYMKMLDPISVVRESEFDTARKAPGVPENIKLMWEKAWKIKSGDLPEGSLFTSKSRKRFAQMAEKLWEDAYKDRKQKFTNQYNGLATRAGGNQLNVTGVASQTKQDNKTGDADPEILVPGGYLLPPSISPRPRWVGTDCLDRIHPVYSAGLYVSAYLLISIYYLDTMHAWWWAYGQLRYEDR